MYKVQGKILFMRIVVMYAVVAAVSLVSRFERYRRREAVERERELQRERIELSQTIHDTIAQSTYVIGLGLETAIDLAREHKEHPLDDLLSKLDATHALSRIHYVGAEASDRHRSNLRGSGVEQGIAITRFNLRHDHLDSHGVCPVWGGATTPSDHEAAALLDRS